MKKHVLAMLTVFALIFTFSLPAFAAEIPAKMTGAVVNALKEKHYDFKEGSLSLTSVQSFPNNDPTLNANDVVVAVAKFQTVRDHIFNIDNTELVFYNPKTNEVLSEVAGAKANKDIKNYTTAHQSEISTQLHYSTVISLLSVLLIVPLLIFFFWEKKQYLTTEFKIKNNLLNAKTYR